MVTRQHECEKTMFGILLVDIKGLAIDAGSSTVELGHGNV